MLLHALPIRRRKLKYVQIYYFIPFILHDAPNLMSLFAHIFFSAPFLYFSCGGVYESNKNKICIGM